MGVQLYIKHTYTNNIQKHTYTNNIQQTYIYKQFTKNIHIQITYKHLQQTYKQYTENLSTRLNFGAPLN